MSNAVQFLDPGAPIDQHKRRLPHWHQKNTLCFVTWHMADSIPGGKLAQLMEEKDAWLARHPKPWDILTETEYHRLFFNRIETWLDRALGSCVLRDRNNSLIVSDALLHFDNQRYHVDSFVVMPNHVHLLFRLNDMNRLEKVVQSLKSYTGRAINKRLAKHGQFWHSEYWDRLIRNEAHLYRCRQYILNNPLKVNLACESYILYQDGKIINP
jgi:type I restriction enzyme R subunit